MSTGTVRTRGRAISARVRVVFPARAVRRTCAAPPRVGTADAAWRSRRCAGAAAVPPATAAPPVTSPSPATLSPVRTAASACRPPMGVTGQCRGQLWSVSVVVSTGHRRSQYRSVWWSVQVSQCYGQYRSVLWSGQVSVVVSMGQCGCQYRSLWSVQVSVVVSTGHCCGQYRSVWWSVPVSVAPFLFYCLQVRLIYLCCRVVWLIYLCCRVVK